MPSTTTTGGFLTVLLFSTSLANPLPKPNGVTLLRRLAVNYVDCDDTQKTKLGTAFADASVLANYAYNGMDDGRLPDSKAWSHYFRTEGGGKTDDINNAKSVFSSIASNNDPTNAPYTFSVRCGKTDHPSCKDGKSLAITDAKPQDGSAFREMLICPLFFKPDTAETMNDLSSRKFEKPKRGSNSWCAPGNNFKFYEVAGHTIFHEMTHLDGVGKSASLPEVEHEDPDGTKWKTHGTEDVDGLGEYYPLAARKLAELWQKGNEPAGALKPFQNAENLAAAALEWYMTKSCAEVGEDIGEIRL